MKLYTIVSLGLCLNLCNAALSGAVLPPVPKISATPASVNLGSVALGASSPQKVITVRNTGKSELIISSVSTTGTDGDEFSQTNDCGTVQPGSSCLVTVTFTPNPPYAKKTAILAIDSNASNKPSLTITLSGTVPPPAISATPAALNFGKLSAGTANSSKSVIVRNSGLSDLVIDSVTISGTNPDDFTVTGSDCGDLPVTIPKGASCTITVKFTPLASNVIRSANLVISSNDPKKPSVSLKLSGTGTTGPTSSWNSSQWDKATWGP